MQEEIKKYVEAYFLGVPVTVVNGGDEIVVGHGTPIIKTMPEDFLQHHGINSREHNEEVQFNAV